jgi:hypothetical protein
MKKLAAFTLALLLTSGTVLADTPKDTGPQAEKPAPKSKSKVHVPTAQEKRDAAIAAQLEQLRQSVEAQQQQLQILKDELAKRDRQIEEARQAAAAADTKASDATAKAAEAATATADLKTAAAAETETDTQLNNRIVRVEKDADATKKDTTTKIQALSSLKFSGDLRLRFEDFFGGNAASAAPQQVRNRERYRMRFNVTSKITDDFNVGFSLASGDVGDPISTNSTETGFFTRKAITIDKAFGTYNPHYFKPLSITAGKFGYTWYRTELTFDNDLNPEGASETVAWDFKDKFLSHFGVVAFQLPMFEVSAGPDSAIYGGQVQTGWRLGPRVKLTADAAFYNYKNADTIAQNQNTSNGTNNGFPTSGVPNNGGGNFGFGTATLSNNFGVINGKRAFASQFGIFDSILRADWDTGHARWPIYTLFDYAVNTKTCSNMQIFADAILAGGTVTTPTCDSHQRHAYWAEAQLGQTKNKHDFRFGYTFMRIERDAVVSAFNFSDIRQPTNVAQHRIEVFYQAYKNVTFGYTGFFGRQLINSQSPTEERLLKRFQFDTIFTF